MPERLKKAVMAVAALAALALGAGAIAQAGSDGQRQASQHERTAADRDDVQHENEGAERGENGDRDEPGDRDEREAGEAEEHDGSATGPAAERAKAAALDITGGGTANSVERDSENGAVWEVEITKRDGSTVDVRLDQDYGKVAVEGDSTR